MTIPSKSPAGAASQLFFRIAANVAAPSAAPITATVVPADCCIDSMFAHFGECCLHVEAGVCSVLEYLRGERHEGRWRVVELSNGGLYMAPETDRALRLYCEGNRFEGTVDAETAGIIASLMALSQLSFPLSEPRVAEAFYRLRDYALEHREVGVIFRAID